MIFVDTLEDVHEFKERRRDCRCVRVYWRDKCIVVVAYMFINVYVEVYSLHSAVKLFSDVSGCMQIRRIE